MSRLELRSPESLCLARTPNSGVVEFASSLGKILSPLCAPFRLSSWRKFIELTTNTTLHSSPSAVALSPAAQCYHRFSIGALILNALFYATLSQTYLARYFVSKTQLLLANKSGQV